MTRYIVIVIGLLVLAAACVHHVKAPSPIDLDRTIYLDSRDTRQVCIDRGDGAFAMEDPKLNFSCMSTKDLQRLIGNLHKSEQ